MITNTDRNDDAPEGNRRLNPIGSALDAPQLQDSALLNASITNAADHLIGYNGNEQRRNINLLAHPPPSRIMASPLLRSDLLVDMNHPPNRLETVQFAYEPALLRRPLRSHLPLFPSNQRVEQIITPPIAPASPICQSYQTSFATNALLQNHSEAHRLSSSIIRSAGFHARSTLQDINALLHRNSLDQAAIRLKIEPPPKSFPMVLHRALTELDIIIGGSEIASFLPDGKSFKICNQFLFEKRILPIFFPNMKNFASFQRQLNLYDFKRVGESCLGRGGYCHPLFDRQLPALASTMKRRAFKG